MKELREFWKQLESGTDIRGVAVAGIAGQPMNLTSDVVSKAAQGYVEWLHRKAGVSMADMKIAVGHDSRISAPRLREAVLAGISKMGATVLDCGLSTTPSMFLTTVDLGCTGAIEITASHHPYHRNGLKFFTRAGGLDHDDIREILGYAQELYELQQADVPGLVVPVRYLDTYSRRLREMICSQVQGEEYDKPLKGFHIVVDAGNGAGGFYAHEVLEPLGADVSGSQFLEPDGHFPNHVPNPEDPQAMQAVCEAVIRHKADFGVIFDTDVDRAGAVGADGTPINRNRLLALASAIVLAEEPGATVVTDSITSDGLKTYLEQTLGGVHHRFKRGYKNVINEAVRLNESGINCPLAMETSGHAAMRENYFLDDGAYLITKLIIQMARLHQEGKTLESLLAPLAEPKETLELRLPILSQQFRETGEQVLQQLEACAKERGWQIAPDNREGLRVSFEPGCGDGWFLLRLSVHDPILPLNVESNGEGGVRQILQELAPFLEDCQGIQADCVREFLGA